MDVADLLEQRTRWLTALTLDRRLTDSEARIGATMVLAHLHLKEGPLLGRMWPSVTLLMKETGAAKRTVQRARSRMISFGYLEAEVVGIGGDGENRLSRYRLTLPAAAPCQQEHRASSGTVPPGAPHGATSGAGTVPPAAPNLEKRDLGKETSSLRSQHADEAFDRFWDQWPVKDGRKAARRAFPAALKKVSLDDLIAGVHRYVENKPVDRQWMLPGTWLNGERWNDQLVVAQQIVEAKQSGDDGRRAKLHRAYAEAALKKPEYDRDGVLRIPSNLPIDVFNSGNMTPADTGSIRLIIAEIEAARLQQAAE